MRAVTRPDGATARRVRTAAFSLVTVGLAVGAHVAAGGVAPALPVLALLALLVDAGAGAFLRRPRGVLGTGLALAAGQIGLHAGFVMTSPTHDSLGPGAVLVSPAMAAWHALASLVLAAVLSHGEELLRRLLALVLPLHDIAFFEAPARPAGPRWATTPFAGRHGRGFRLGCTLRGPPRRPATA